MFLNVGGAVLGVAVLTVISDSVTSNYGGKGNPVANLEGYRAGYYGALAMIAIGFILSIFFYQKEQQEDRPLQQEGENQEGENQKEGEQERKGQEGKEHGSKDNEKKAEPDEVRIASTHTSTIAMASEKESKDNPKS